MDKEYLDLIATVRDSGSETKEITLDKKVCDYLGLKVGDVVKIMIKKIEDNKE